MFDWVEIYFSDGQNDQNIGSEIEMNWQW